MSKITYHIEGIDYQPSGWLGSQLESYEKIEKEVGYTRVIDNELFFVYMSQKYLGPKRWKLSWCMYKLNTMALNDRNVAIQELYKRLGSSE